MKRISLCLLSAAATAASLIPQGLYAQEKLPVPLTVEKIMRDPRWIGSSPSSPSWSADGRTLFLDWNPPAAHPDSLKSVPADDSVWYVDAAHPRPVKTTATERKQFVPANSVSYNRDRTAYVYEQDDDIFFQSAKSGTPRRITHTADRESAPQFSGKEQWVVYTRAQNLYAFELSTGLTTQLTNLVAGPAPLPPAAGTTGRARSSAEQVSGTEQERWLKQDQLEQLQVLKERKQKRELRDLAAKADKPVELKPIYLDGRSVQGLQVNAGGQYVSYTSFKPVAGNKTTIVPNYVTESGFTTDINARTKVGLSSPSNTLHVFDRRRDTVYAVSIDSVEGIRDLPAYLRDYPARDSVLRKKTALREVRFTNPAWSPDGRYLLVDLRSGDNKDRWIMCWDTASQRLRLIDRQHDDAWIAGPGIYGSLGWLDDHTVWFQSEATGYSHLYRYDLVSAGKSAITSGTFEVIQAKLSNDRQYFYVTSNEVHPGEQHLYKIRISDRRTVRITSGTGANQVTISPDEQTAAVLYSSALQPWELFLQPLPTGAGSVVKDRVQLTDRAASPEFRSYPWREPEVVAIPAADGQQIYARIYKPANLKPGMPAVLFVHGAGYLQNAHKWWSSYFREFMFNNLLADEGFIVLDIDYRGSAGYGRDWRTGIYRHMGGKDLSDHVDAVKYLQQQFKIDPKRVGLYGGSYGGFITLMALFREPDVFRSGAALRPVTDWANYNHQYTANILNEPFTDSIAYRQSSPWYFADGLRGNLLICHGMVDVNVHYQDAVKLTQRLIELGKENWELASYPMEDHGFVEPSSWTDEYKRILKLFRGTLLP